MYENGGLCSFQATQSAIAIHACEAPQVFEASVKAGMSNNRNTLFLRRLWATPGNYF